jgi:preprotein translocase subunit SecG
VANLQQVLAAVVSGIFFVITLLAAIRTKRKHDYLRLQ